MFRSACLLGLFHFCLESFFRSVFLKLSDNFIRSFFEFQVYFTLIKKFWSIFYHLHKMSLFIFSILYFDRFLSRQCNEGGLVNTIRSSVIVDYIQWIFRSYWTRIKLLLTTNRLTHANFFCWVSTGVDNQVNFYSKNKFWYLSIFMQALKLTNQLLELGTTIRRKKLKLKNQNLFCLFAAAHSFHSSKNTSMVIWWLKCYLSE
jgi:hypothetical protein